MASKSSSRVWQHPGDPSEGNNTTHSSCVTVSSSNTQMKDECLSYLNSLEIEYFLTTLVKEVLNVSPDDPVAYAAHFFHKVYTFSYLFAASFLSSLFLLPGEVLSACGVARSQIY